VAGAGQEISTRPFQLVTGRVWRGRLRRRARPQRTAELCEALHAGEIRWTTSSPTPWRWSTSTRFDLMHEGKSIRTVIHY
jgi:S-(hydroxymethyl)glutathione dehydrogenase/alcohol dehydrogenase